VTPYSEQYFPPSNFLDNIPKNFTFILEILFFCFRRTSFHGFERILFCVILLEI
jgi:hypothetical protein